MEEIGQASVPVHQVGHGIFRQNTKPGRNSLVQDSSQPARRRDHTAIGIRIKALRHSEAGLEVRLLAGCLESVLISHADIEDAILRPPTEEHLPVPPLNPDGSPGPADHQVIRRLLTGAVEAADVEEARRYLVQTIADTYRHFEKEETKIFGIAERELSETAQREFGAGWAVRRGVRLEGCPGATRGFQDEAHQGR